jgi:ligand-binding sensor domain-containing protein/signal transduction histidine kinase
MCLRAETKKMSDSPRRTVALAAFALLVQHATCALAAPGTNAVVAVRPVLIDPNVVRLGVTDGHDLRFLRLTRAQGVLQTRVSNIVQDNRGFLWFATQYGLNRYDGYSFRLFKHIDDDPRSLKDSYVRVLFKDREGRLWAAPQHPGMLNRYDPTTETFSHYKLEPPSSSQLRNSPEPVVAAKHISQDRDGSLWIATAQGLYRMDPSTGQATVFRHQTDDPTSLSSDDVRSSGVDRNGILWVATAEGLDAFDRSTARVTMRVPLREPREMSIYEDRSGTLWIIHASGDGLAALDRQSGVLTQYSFASRPMNTDALTGVSSMFEDRDGQLWVGTQSDGLLRLDRSRLRAIRYRNDPLDAESLSEDRITSLTQDREGNIWVGLGASEPNYFTPHSGPFDPLPFDFADSRNLGERLVNTLYEDRHGTLWIGTTGTLCKYDRATRSYTRLPLPGTADGSDVLAIVEDRSGVLWVGTSGQGLARFDPLSNKAKLYRHLPASPSGLSNNTITHLLVDHAGALWATTLDGLNRYDPVTDSFRSFRSDSGGSPVYVSLVEDSKGSLWISGAAGIQHFDPTTERFVEFKEGLSVKGYAVVAASNGEIWAGTQDGLYRLDPSAHTSRRYTERDGLAGNSVSCLLEDSRHDIWMSTTEGLSTFLAKTGQFHNYSVQDGLPGRDFTGWSACFRSPRGVLYFGGFAGAVAFYPEKLATSVAYTPSVALTSFQLFGKPVPVGPDSPLKRAIDYTDQLTLTHDQNSFAFEFAALSFTNPPSNRYRYRLEGFDQDWTVVGSEHRVANYTALLPGSYVFRVQGATIRGPWGLPGASVAIRIPPPWWETWWFRTAVGLLIILVAWLFYRLRIRQVSRQLTIRVEERLGERTRIAQELHDTVLQGLTSASLQLEVADRQIAADATAKPLVQRISQLLRQLTDESRHTVRGLRLRYSEEESLERALTQISKDLATPHKVKYQVVVEGTPRSLRPLVRDEIYRMGGEALANAFRHAHASTVETVLEYGRAHFRLLVRDDGKGIDPEVLEGGREGHFGLSGLRERAAKIEAQVKIRTAAGAGTEIDLIVPATAAFERSNSHGSMSWLARLYFRGNTS